MLSYVIHKYNNFCVLDVRFLVDDGAIRAHKPLLMGRCEMMYAMFNDNFMESSADSVSSTC